MPIPDPEISVGFHNVPFWTALDAVLDQAQLSIYPYGQPRALQIVPRGPTALPRTGRAAIFRSDADRAGFGCGQAQTAKFIASGPADLQWK